MPACIRCCPCSGEMMVNQDERELYRSFGSRLADVLRQSQGPLPAAPVLQAIAADVLGDRTDLLLPLKYLVACPGFLRLISKAGSGSGAVERQALVADLEKTFAPSVIDAIDELLGGFLDLPVATTQVAQSPVEHLNSSAASSVVLSQDKSVFATDEAVQIVATPLNEKIKQHSPRRVMRVLRWLGVAAVSGVATVGLVLLFRSSTVCVALGFCKSSIPTTVDKAIAAATQAAKGLEDSTSLEGYREAAEALERKLLPLKDLSLPTDQKTAVERLFGFNGRVKVAMAEEKVAQERIKQARDAIDSAANASLPDRQKRLEQARNALREIPSKSFSAEQALQLLKSIESLISELQMNSRSVPGAGSHSLELPVSTPPTLHRQAKPDSGTGNPEGWRDRPLF